MKEQYKKTIADRLSISVDDLSETELQIIEITFDIFDARLEDIQILTDENKRISIELANLKASLDDKDYGEEE